MAKGGMTVKVGENVKEVEGVAVRESTREKAHGPSEGASDKWLDGHTSYSRFVAIKNTGVWNLLWIIEIHKMATARLLLVESTEGHCLEIDGIKWYQVELN